MQFNLDFFEPPALSPDLEWMLQSHQVSDSDLAVQLAEDYASRLHFLALFTLGDEARAGRATAAALQLIVRQRAQFWGQVPLRAWVYAQAKRMIQHQMTLAWRLRRWVDRRRLASSPPAGLMALRLALLRLDPYLALPLSLVYGHDLPEAEAALALDIPQDQLQELLVQAEQNLPAHTSEELAQAAHLAGPGPSEPKDTVQALPTDSGPDQPKFQRRLLSQVLPNLTRQAQRGKLRLLIAEVALAGLVLAAALLIGMYAVKLEAQEDKNSQPGGTKITEIIEVTVEITATPGPQTLALSEMSTPLVPKPAPSLTSTPVPRKVQLDLSQAITAIAAPGAPEYTYENAAPVLLGVLLQYQNVTVDAADLAAQLRPNPLDAAVFPYEIEDYILNQTSLRALYRFGGDLELLRRMIDAGLPVLLQKTYTGTGVAGWAAEYALVVGFDDFEQRLELITLRAGSMRSEQILYEDFIPAWLPFGYAYFAIFPPERSGDLARILGENFSDTRNYAVAMEIIHIGLQRNLVQTYWSYFAGATLLTYQGEYQRAALLYDEAFFLSDRLPEEQRPWRALWYNSRPYWAYYYSDNFERVITLADETLADGGNRGLEESLYWRAMARNASGNLTGARADVQAALQVHPQFGPGLYLLEQLSTAP